MRRVLALVLVVLAAVPASACSGAEGQRAEELLAQAQEALAGVRSLSFSAHVWTDGGGDTPAFAVRLEGGGYAKGKRAGDFFMDVNVEGVPLGGSFALVSRGGRTFVQAGGAWTALPSPPAASAAADAGPLAGFDLRRYITDVDVQEGVLVGGEPAAKLTGVIDTAGFFEGVLEQMGGLSELGAAPVPGLSDHLGDTRVVLWVSETSHLPLRGLVDVTVVDVAGREIDVHVDFAFRGIDEPVAMPRPS